MRIAVLMKQVPATDEVRSISLETGRIDRSGTLESDEIGERALEVALSCKDSDKTVHVTAVTMGPAKAKDTVKKALTMGADEAIHVLNEQLAGADAMQTAAVLSQTLQAEGYDVIITGNESTDGRGGVVPSAIAELMGVPVILGAENVEIDDEAVTAEAPVGSGRARVQAQLPLVLSITERNPEPRFPSFKGIIAAKRRPLHQVAGELPETEAVSRVDHVEAAPAKQAGTILEDDGTAVSQLVAFLRERGL